MSIDLEELLLFDRRPLDFGFPRVPRAVGMIAHPVGRYREASLAVVHQPLALNYYHGGVSGKISKKLARMLSATFDIIVPIDQVLAERLANPNGEVF